MDKDDLKELENNVEKLISKEKQEQYYNKFSVRARYIGNGIYTIEGLYSTDTRELFLMYVARLENIDYEEKDTVEDNAEDLY